MLFRSTFGEGIAQYEYVIINIFDTLIYSYLNDKHNFFNLIGQELGIPMFAKIREKVEEELRNSARINGKEKSINVWDIYREIERYTKVPCEKGVETEVRLLERISKVNPYIRAIYEMISYKSKNVLLVEDSIYSSEQLMYLLEEKQITGYKELIISNECGKSIFDGTIFELLETKLETKNVLYIDDSLTGRKQAKNLSWEIWEYKDIKEFGKDFRLDGMSVLISDVYSSIISQRMYCGHFAYSLQYEAGFLYYGLFVAGYIKWINSQIKKLKIEKVLFLEETSDLLKKCFEIIAENKEIKQDVLWITEDFAVKILVEKYPIFFYEHYVKKYINSNKPISFYLEKMGLFGMADKLSNYGLNASDIISRDSIYYGAFVDFIEDNFAIIQESIAQEKRAFCMYLKGLRIKEKNIAVVDVSGKGYIALAMEMILKEELNIVCRVRELAAFQSIETEELLYNNWVQAYISADNIRTGDIRIIDNELIQNRTRNILSNIAPLFKKIVVNDAGIFEFVYEGAYPWKYKNIEDNQNGIVDFVKEYANFLKMSRISCQVLPEDVLRVLNHLYKRTNYVTKVFSIIRS